MTNISTEPYWWAAAPPQNFEMDSWPTRADVVIIGGVTLDLEPQYHWREPDLMWLFLNGIRLDQGLQRVTEA